MEKFEMQLKPYQEEAIQFSANRPNTLIALDMGLGKSAVAIEAMNRFPAIPQTLIVCPASVQLNWEREIKIWGKKPYFPVIISSGKQIHLSENVWIISYNLLRAWREKIRKMQWDILILDEAHYLKNAKSIRAKEVFGNKNRLNFISPIQAKKTLALTGTPLLNRPLELWTLVHAFDSQGIGKDWFSFVHKYCNAHKRYVTRTKTILDCTGSSNLNDLHNKIQKFTIRRTKDEVACDLPEKTRQKVVLSSEHMRREIREEKETYEKHKSGSETLTALIAARIAVAKKKLPYIIEHTRNILEQEEKVCIFFWHHEIGDALFEEFKAENAARLDGRMNIEERQKNIDKFQTDPTCQVFIGSIAAAGVGISLTAASTSVFAELSWVPGELIQAEDRIHRIGQKSLVLIQYLIAKDSIDDYMLDTLIEKKKVINQVL